MPIYMIHNIIQLFNYKLKPVMIMECKELLCDAEFDSHLEVFKSKFTSEILDLHRRNMN